MISKFTKKNTEGYSLAELLIVLAISILILGISMTAFVNFRNSKALEMDTKMIVEVLREARNQTLTSQYTSQYGVHFNATGNSQAISFVGPTFIDGAATNKIYSLESKGVNLTVILQGGGSDIVFNRLTGETTQSGTILIYSPQVTNTKTITVYKTGLIDSQ